MTTATLTDMQQRVSELFDIDSVSKVDTIIRELEGYGIETEETLDDTYSGCYPSESSFVEDTIDGICDVYELPSIIANAIDYELIWYQSMQYDYFAIYHDAEYYFFNRNF